MIIHRYSLCDTVGSNCCGTSSLHTGYSHRSFQGYVRMGSFVHDLSSGHRLFSSLKLHFLMTRQVVQSDCIILGGKLPLLSRVSLPATKPSNKLLSQLKLELEQRASSSGRCSMEGEMFQNEGISNGDI